MSVWAGPMAVPSTLSSSPVPLVDKAHPVLTDVSVVVAAYMGGLAAGSWALGRAADRDAVSDR